MNAYSRKSANGYSNVVCVENAKILGGGWSDFGGNSSQFSNGTHHFKIEVDDQFVDFLKSQGFDVKWYQKNEDYQGFYFLDINLSWKNRDPNVFLVAYNGTKTRMSEETIGDLDGNRNIDYADMELGASHWEYMGKKGVKPYASNLYIYLGQPSFAEQRYLERYGNVAVERTPIPTPEPVQETFIPNDEDDIPF